MIRLIQRKLIIPRGDTGSFSIPALPTITSEDVGVFSIFDVKTRTRLVEKTAQASNGTLTFNFSHNDTVNLLPGHYSWDVKFYRNPVYADGKLINGEEIDSYYAGHILPDCEIKETGDNLLISDNAPTGTLTPEQLDIISSALTEMGNLKRSVVDSESHAEGYAQSASNDANLAEGYKTDAANSAADALASQNAAAGSANDAARDAGIATSAKNDAETAARNAANSETATLGYLNQITGLTATATQLSSTASPTASYNSSIGVLSLGIPAGVGISSVTLNNDYTLTFNLNNGQSITTASVRGPQGPQGDAFHIVKTYASIAAMNADYSGNDVTIGQFVMVVSSVEDPDNAKVYVKGDQQYNFIVDMSGATGLQGPQGNGIASISITYQASIDNTIAPNGTWLNSPPDVPAGNYLWTKIVLNYTDTTSSLPIYTVVRQGTVINVATIQETQEIINAYEDDEDMVFDANYIPADYAFVTEADASDIAAAYKAGKHVVIHFIADEETRGYSTYEDGYYSLIGYENYNEEHSKPAYGRIVFDDGLHSYGVGITGWEINANGKLSFGIYID